LHYLPRPKPLARLAPFPAPQLHWDQPWHRSTTTPPAVTPPPPYTTVFPTTPYYFISPKAQFANGGHFQRQPDRQPLRPQRWLATTGCQIDDQYTAPVSKRSGVEIQIQCVQWKIARVCIGVESLLGTDLITRGVPTSLFPVPVPGR
jgi:hypothetical protein